MKLFVNQNIKCKLSICFIAHYAYGSISGTAEGHIGGIERQTEIMSKWLAKREHEISVITWDEGQENDEYHEGVRIIKVCGMNEGIRGLRYIHPRLTSLIAALQYADADIYYHNGSEDITGQVGLWCKLNGKKFIFSSASDVDCDKELPELRHLHERILYKIGIKLAHLNITQTRLQKKAFFNSFNLDSKVLPMPCEGPIGTEYDQRKFPQEINILWIGRINRDKRLELFLEIAKRFKDIKFHVAGKPNNTNYPEIMFQEMKKYANVKYHGALEKNKMKELYNDAFALCNTSKYEGFPNTYLEAWSYGIPVLTTVDPDGIIQSNDLGYKLNNVREFNEKISELLGSMDLWERLSRSARNYYIKFHQVDAVMKKFEQAFVEVAVKDNLDNENIQ
jgi:glycosyltransferase involved in cell wall biosynthesis